MTSCRDGHDWLILIAIYFLGQRGSTTHQSAQNGCYFFGLITSSSIAIQMWYPQCSLVLVTQIAIASHPRNARVMQYLGSHHKPIKKQKKLFGPMKCPIHAFGHFYHTYYCSNRKLARTKPQEHLPTQQAGGTSFIRDCKWWPLCFQVYSICCKCQSRNPTWVLFGFGFRLLRSGFYP